MGFGDVNPHWYTDFYWKLKAKLQVQRQIHLLIFDTPDEAMEVPASEYKVSWRFIAPYTDAKRMIANTFCGLWSTEAIEHLMCVQRPNESLRSEALASVRHLLNPAATKNIGLLSKYGRQAHLNRKPGPQPLFRGRLLPSRRRRIEYLCLNKFFNLGRIDIGTIHGLVAMVKTFTLFGPRISKILCYVCSMSHHVYVLIPAYRRLVYRHITIPASGVYNSHLNTSYPIRCYDWVKFKTSVR